MSDRPKRFVYVLKSVANRSRHYVGLTSDVGKRLATHNAGSSLYTSRHRPWAVLVTIEFADPGRAAEFERYLKSPSGRAFAKRHFTW